MPILFLLATHKHIGIRALNLWLDTCRSTKLAVMCILHPNISKYRKSSDWKCSGTGKMFRCWIYLQFHSFVGKNLNQNQYCFELQTTTKHFLSNHKMCSFGCILIKRFPGNNVKLKEQNVLLKLISDFEWKSVLDFPFIYIDFWPGVG